MYNIEIHSIDSQRVKATAYKSLQMQTRRLGWGKMSVPVPTVSAYDDEAIHLTITDTNTVDADGKSVDERFINPAQLNAVRNEMMLYRSAAWRFAAPILFVCGAILLLLSVACAVLGMSEPQLKDAIYPLQVGSGVACAALGAVLLFMFGFSGVFSLVAFYGPQLTVTKEKDAGLLGWNFALRSSRVTTAEKIVLQLPEDFRARLEKYIAPAKLIFALPGASDGEILLYHNANGEAGFSQYNFVSFPLYGAQPVGLMRINGEVRTLYLDQHPFDPSANWPYRDMRNASEEKYLKAVEAICKAIYQNETLFITTGAMNSGQLISAYTETMKRVASILFFCFASFALSAQSIAAVAKLNGAAEYVPDMGERVVYMFEKGNLPAVGNGVSTLPELLRDIPGFHDNENRGQINKVVTITKDNRRKDFPLQKAPESARPVVTSVAPAVDDGFMWGDSAANVRMYREMKNKGRKAIIQAGSAGGIGGFLDVLLVVLLPVWLLLVVIFLVIANTATSEITHFRRFHSVFVSASEITRFLIWSFLITGFVIGFAKYFFWSIENWFQWYDFIGYALWVWAGQWAVSSLVKNPTFAQQSGGRDLIAR